VLETGEIVLDGEAKSLLGNSRVQASYLGGGH
jgi:ABC-type branched-subunit amino acid transport system ATPase component